MSTSKFRSQFIPEAILIIVSILIAFAIDAWWEERQQLVQWPSLVADAIENNHFLRLVAGPRAFDYLAERVDLGFADQIVRCKSEKSHDDCPPVSFELEATGELSGVVSHIRGWSTEGARELEVVRQEALDLVRVLDEELAKK